jgi:hypothetical protein
MALLKPLDVFLDIENIAEKLGDPVRFYNTVEGLKKLPGNLAKRGYQMRVGWTASAHYIRYPIYRSQLAHIWGSLGFHTDWTSSWEEIADTLLLARMRECIKQHALAPHVLLMSGDGCFSEVLVTENLRRYFIVASWPDSMSNALRFLAHETWDVAELFE